MKLTVIPSVVGALGTILKGFVKTLEDLKADLETIQTTALLKSARILRSVLETCCHSNPSEKPPANAGAKKNYRKSKITIIILNIIIIIP